MDGFRALAEISDGEPRLISRRGNTYRRLVQDPQPALFAV